MRNVPWTAIVFLLGVAAITAGFALLHPAAGLIVGGLQLAYIATQLDADAGRANEAPTS